MGGLWRWSQVWVFYLIYSSFFSALKQHLVYQNWSRHFNFTIEKGSKILIVFYIIFSMFSSISKKAHGHKAPFRCAASWMSASNLRRITLTFNFTIQIFVYSCQYRNIIYMWWHKQQFFLPRAFSTWHNMQHDFSTFQIHESSHMKMWDKYFWQLYIQQLHNDSTL